MFRILLIVSLVAISSIFSHTIFARSMPQGYENTPVLKGDSTLYPSALSEYFWYVRNPQGISNGFKHFKFGEQCHARSGAKLVVIGFDGDSVVIQYQISNTQGGTYCPNETIFYEKQFMFNKLRWFREYEDYRLKKEVERKERIKNTLSN